MKKIFMVLFLVLTVALFAEGTIDSSAQEQTRQAAQNATENAMAQIPIPQLSYFTERKTIAAWYVRWDKPSVITYVYLVSYGNVIGYYVCNGKPASTGSVLNPEYVQTYYSSGGVIEKQQQDLDGTYGSNNPGIRFFTAEGTAVEWAGIGASYIYSDAPLPLNVPILYSKVSK
jgi:hypothetical protein